MSVYCRCPADRPDVGGISTRHVGIGQTSIKRRLGACPLFSLALHVAEVTLDTGLTSALRLPLLCQSDCAGAGRRRGR